MAGMIYKGSIDIKVAPPTGAAAGSVYTVATAGKPNAGFTGLPSTVNAGDQIIFDGTNWQLLSSKADPDLWTRTGTTLSPATAGDVVTVSAGTAALPGLRPVGDPDTGIWAPAADTLAISTGGTSRVHVAADGKVGIGTATPAAKLHVETNEAVGVARFTNTLSSSFSGVYLRNDAAKGIALYSYGSAYAGSTILNVGAGNHGISAAGDLAINADAGKSLRLGVGLVEGARIASNGKVGIGVTAPTAAGGILQLAGGITFPATPVASTDPNTLDDYEEGTFAPTIVGVTTAGVGTYTLNKGTYTKIGKTVFYSLYIAWTAHTGTGMMRIGGLPFANGVDAFTAAVQLSNMTFTGQIVLSAISNSSQLNIRSLTSNAAVADVAIDHAAEIRASGFYITA